jgi:hypothetical protein
MLIALPSLGIWPPRETPDVAVTPASTYVAGVGVEIVGTPIASVHQVTETVMIQSTPAVITETYRTVTTTVKVTNNVMQPAPVQGTPTPGAPTPAPEPASIINVSVKVLFYDLPRTDPNKKIVGSGIGNYYNADGLPPGGTAELIVVATDVGAFNEESGYEAFADGLWTDKDPLKTPEPLTMRPPGPAQAFLRARNHTP